MFIIIGNRQGNHNQEENKEFIKQSCDLDPQKKKYLHTQNIHITLLDIVTRFTVSCIYQQLTLYLIAYVLHIIHAHTINSHCITHFTLCCHLTLKHISHCTVNVQNNTFHLIHLLYTHFATLCKTQIFNCISYSPTMQILREIRRVLYIQFNTLNKQQDKYSSHKRGKLTMAYWLTLFTYTQGGTSLWKWTLGAYLAR